MDFRRILEEARNKQGRVILDTFCSEGPSEFLIVSRARWDEHQRKLGTQKEESRTVAQEVEELEVHQGEMGYEGSPVKVFSNAKKKDAAHAAAKFVLFDERKTVVSGSGRTAQYLEQSGKKGDCCNGKLPGNVR